MPSSQPTPIWFTEGKIYTETVVHAAPPRYTSDAPFQLAIVESPEGGRITARILFADSSSRATIGESVTFAEERDGVPYFRLSSSDPRTIEPPDPLV